MMKKMMTLTLTILICAYLLLGCGNEPAATESTAPTTVTEPATEVSTEPMTEAPTEAATEASTDTSNAGESSGYDNLTDLG